MKKPFEITSWNHVLIEGYCLINLDYRSARSKWLYTINNNLEKTSKIPNPNYDPDVKPVNPPKYCERRICNACLGENGAMCPHFAFSDIDDEFKKVFHEMSRKFYKEEETDK